jgi:hypothetical protein
MLVISAEQPEFVVVIRGNLVGWEIGPYARGARRRLRSFEADTHTDGFQQTPCRVRPPVTVAGSDLDRSERRSKSCRILLSELQPVFGRVAEHLRRVATRRGATARPRSKTFESLDRSVRLIGNT